MHCSKSQSYLIWMPTRTDMKIVNMSDEQVAVLPYLDAHSYLEDGVSYLLGVSQSYLIWMPTRTHMKPIKLILEESQSYLIWMPTRTRH